MPYVRPGSRMRRGVGQTLDSAGNVTGATYDPVTGRYLGGSFLMDLYCGSFLGSSDPVCAIPTPAQIKAAQIAELAATSAPPAVQAVAVAAGDAAVAADMAANPSNYSGQCAASSYPALSSLIGPGSVAALFGIQPDCSASFMSSLALWVGAGILVLAFWGGKK